MVTIYLFIFFILIVGLLVGSFLNVVIYRLPKGKSIFWGRSACPHCKKKIRWYDNVPLISFIILRGRCRFCHSPISWRYPLVELVTGVLFVLGAFPRLSHLGNLGYLGIAEVFLTWVLFSALIVIFFIDLEHQIIPDRVLLPVILLYSLYSVFSIQYSVLVVAFFSSLFFFLLFLITKGRGMGLGDVKLAFLMGLALGFPKIVIALYLSFLTGAILGVILILVRKARFGKQIPFGPFLAFSTIVVLLWGEKIINLILPFF